MASTKASTALTCTPKFGSIAEAIADANDFHKYGDINDFFRFVIGGKLISPFACPELGEELSTLEIEGLEMVMNVGKDQQRSLIIHGDGKDAYDAVLDKVIVGLKSTPMFKKVKVRGEKVPILSDPDTVIAAVERGFADLFGLPTRGACANMVKETADGPQMMFSIRALNKAYGGYFDWPVGGGATTNPDGSIMTGDKAMEEEMEQELGLTPDMDIELTARSTIFFRRRCSDVDIPGTLKPVRCYQLGSMYIFTLRVGPKAQFCKDGVELIGTNWFSFADAKKVICSGSVKPAAALCQSDFLHSVGQISDDEVKAIREMHAPAEGLVFPRDILDFQAKLEAKYLEEPKSFFTKIPGFTPPHPF